MNTPTTHSTPDPAKAKPMLDEADIGSGEKSPGQAETDKQIRQIPPLPEHDEDDGEEAGGPADRG